MAVRLALVVEAAAVLARPVAVVLVPVRRRSRVGLGRVVFHQISAWEREVNFSVGPEAKSMTGAGGLGEGNLASPACFFISSTDSTRW